MRMLTPQELKKVYSTAMKAQYSIVVLGPPGVGKTASVYQFADELAKQLGVPLIRGEEAERCIHGRCVLFVYVNVNATLPPDISGMPEKVGDTVKWIPLETWKMCRRAAACIVVIDEFNTTQNPDMQALIMRLLSERVAGQTALHGSNVLIVALGNPPENNELANPLPAPLLGGKALILRAKPPTLQEWAAYMRSKHGDNWDTDILAFLSVYPEYFIKVPDDVADEPYPTPRGWEKAAVLCNIDKENCVLYVASLCGDEAARAFETFSNVQLVSLKDIAKMSGLDRKLSLAIWALRKFCRADGDELRMLANEFSGDEIALVTFLTVCNDKKEELYSLLPAEKKKKVFWERYTLSDSEVAE